MPQYGSRIDNTPKGMGYYGALQRQDDPNSVSTELSIGVNIDGKEILIPLIVPTLSQQEIEHLLRGGKATESMYRKAVDYAKKRMSMGKSPFMEQNEKMNTQDYPAEQTQYNKPPGHMS